MVIKNMNNKRKNVFISHIHKDESKLSDLKSLLKKHGIEARDYSVHSGKPNNASNEQYVKNKILAPQIKQAGVLVVYISEATKDSKYVNWEIEYARKHDKPIVGVWEKGSKGCELPEKLDEYRDALVGWKGAGIANAILGDNNIQELPDGSPCPPRPIIRHPC